MKYFVKQYLGALICVSLLTSFMACAQQKNEKHKDSHYQLSNPVVYTMPESLIEISGITILPNMANNIYAVQDEEGKIYTINLVADSTTAYHFSKVGDYEDIGIFKGWLYVLKSNGSLFRVNKNIQHDTDHLESFEIKNKVPKGEYEGLYINEVDSIIYLLCKQCNATEDKKKDRGLIYQLKISTDNEIEKLGAITYEINENKDHNWQPSAIAQHPLSGYWYILSSVNNMLSVYDKDWYWKSTFHLPTSVFNQPEGLCFNAAGDMFICNEGSKTKKGNILFFKY